jgi:recombination protein RecA
VNNVAKLQVLSGRIADPYMLPTPSFNLNRALGGGLLSGRIHIFWGPKASGKTTVALHQIAEAQRLGKRCLFVDAEKTYRASWAEKCGVNVDDLQVIQQGANVAEDLLTVLLPMVEKESIDVVVIDSLSSVLLSSFFEKPESNPVGIFARSAKFVLIKLLNALGPETQIILISHASLDLSGYHPTLTASIGNATAHWASTIIGFKQGNNKKEDFRDDGSRKVRWKIDKSKQNVYPVDGEYWFNAKTATIDQEDEIITAAIELEIISQKASWFSYDGAKYQGTNGIKAAIQEIPDMLDAIKREIEEFDIANREILAQSIDIIPEETPNSIQLYGAS